jgi:hypothetical protein
VIGGGFSHKNAQHRSSHSADRKNAIRAVRLCGAVRARQVQHRQIGPRYHPAEVAIDQLAERRVEPRATWLNMARSW